jgi:hypothetical protein
MKIYINKITMSKASMGDLKELITGIADELKKSTKVIMANDARIEELFQAINLINTKIDALSTMTDQNKTPVKKTIRKAAPKKTAAAGAKKPTVRKTNPVMFVALMKNNPDKYNKYLSQEVKNEIDAKHEAKWEELDGEELLDAKYRAYYDYIKTKHKKVVETIKGDYEKMTTGSSGAVPKKPINKANGKAPKPANNEAEEDADNADNAGEDDVEEPEDE